MLQMVELYKGSDDSACNTNSSAVEHSNDNITMSAIEGELRQRDTQISSLKAEIAMLKVTVEWIPESS